MFFVNSLEIIDSALTDINKGNKVVLPFLKFRNSTEELNTKIMKLLVSILIAVALMETIVRYQSA